jgi:hypothetical protein
MISKSYLISNCQVCNSKNLISKLFLGYHPTVNDFTKIGKINLYIEKYPLEILLCKKCSLTQLGVAIDGKKIFPKNYAYRSGTTKILIDNFKSLARESQKLKLFQINDRVVDIGSNDGTLLKNFKEINCEVLGIEPTNVGFIAKKNGINTIISPFNYKLAKKISKKKKAKVITAANVFAHIENVHNIMKGISVLLDKKGVFISESHYLINLLKTLQYDTIYHEHLRYYSLKSLKFLFSKFNFHIFHAKKIPTHGGSIRVYASRVKYKMTNSCKTLIRQEKKYNNLDKTLSSFANKVNRSKIKILNLLSKLKLKNKKIVGISAPSRASTLINYLGLDNAMIDYICEVKGSLKINKYMPGTNIEVVDEKYLYNDQPDYALLFSWHISNDIISNLRKKGFKGKFIIPLPNPRII